MKTFVLAMVATLALASPVLAEEFQARITKVEGNEVTFFKESKGKKAEIATTAEASTDVKVIRRKRGSPGSPPEFDLIEDGLSSSLFWNIDPMKGLREGPVLITIDDKTGRITQICFPRPPEGKGGPPRTKKGVHSDQLAPHIPV